MVGRKGKRKNNPPDAKPARAVKSAPPAAVADLPARRLVVGIGASAGGLEAFQTFFANMPPDSGLAFVLVQHLDPHHKSMLVELLSKYTKMKVREAQDGAFAAPNTIFIIPPDATLTIKDAKLYVLRPAPDRQIRWPIDSFLFSLAEDQGENAVCIILSGGGSDGTLGLRAIKEQGGLTLAQSQFDEFALAGMPSSAANTGLVDHVMPVEKMPAKLLAYRDHLTDTDARKGSDGLRQDASDHVKEICAYLRKELGHDFSRYKEATLIRRIQRRMQVLQVATVPGYIETLRKDPAQLELLFRDLLIGVTHFFRDASAFEALEASVVPQIVQSKSADDQIRVWVAGCATGQEAYSIAILLQEAIAKRRVKPKITIFGTDIDDRAITIARAGRYQKSLLDEMSPKRRDRWFIEDGDHFCPIKELRESCIFSVHSIIKDPPFSKLDLISCRNLLIYLDTSLQDRVLPIFHYALRPSGYLFLGPSEGVGRRGELFAATDKKHRIFRRRDDAVTVLPSLSSPRALDQMPSRDGVQAPRSLEDDIASRLGSLVERYAPAHLVIDKLHEVVRFSGRTGKYLEPSTGPASLKLFSVLKKELRPIVRAMLQEAVETRQRVLRQNVPIQVEGNTQLINLSVESLPGSAATSESKLYVVGFHDHEATNSLVDLNLLSPPVRIGKVNKHDAETELRATRAHLQLAIDEAERANEELKSSNEEYQSVNEELQSTNEELETSKEEMQSINEELQTVNAELNSKNELMGRLNGDLKNLLESTQIATVFLGEDLHVRSFTPAMTAIFSIRDTDRGRPITDLANRLGYGTIREDVENVLRTLSVVEREINLAGHEATYIMRIRPYRTIDKLLDGVVITFIDIADRKRSEQLHAELAAIVESSEDAIIRHSLDGMITSWNGAAERIFGYRAAEAIGKPLSILIPADRLDDVPNILEKLKLGERVQHFDISRVGKGNIAIDVSVSFSSIKNERGEMIAASMIARDVTERAHAEAHSLLLMAELDHRVKNSLATVQSIAMFTAGSAGSVKEFSLAFDARLMALSHTHDLLIRNKWEGADLRDVIEAELSPYQDANSTRCTIFGARIMLESKRVLALGMAVHELAVNAAKYGAFSGTEGQVKVTWEVREGGEGRRLVLTWIESGGPPVLSPQRRGFGSQLITDALAHELQGEVRLDFDPAGVRCNMEFPLGPDVEIT
jgi:two-component system CheB/CheR fusion protein